MSNPTPEAMQAALAFLAQFFGPGGPDGLSGHAPAPQSTTRQPAGTPPPRPPAGTLLADLAVTETNLLLQIALPGLPAAEALSLRLLTPTELLVEAWLPPLPGLPLQTELPMGLQSRLFQLPVPVLGASLVSRYESGILTLTFAKAPA